MRTASSINFDKTPVFISLVTALQVLTMASNKFSIPNPSLAEMRTTSENLTKLKRRSISFKKFSFRDLSTSPTCLRRSQEPFRCSVLDLIDLGLER